MSAEDKFIFDHDNSPATKAFTITPNDSSETTFITRALYTGKGGDICCVLKEDNTEITFNNVPTGSILPVRVKKVLATDTTAENILGLY